MAYKVVFKASARKELQKITKNDYVRIRKAIDGLAYNPKPRQARKLVNSQRGWRLRIGDYRVIYDIQKKELMILIIKVGHRGRVYK